MKNSFFLLLLNTLAFAAVAQPVTLPTYASSRSVREGAAAAPTVVAAPAAPTLVGFWTGPLAIPGKSLAVGLAISQLGDKLTAVLEMPGSQLHRHALTLTQRRDTLRFADPQSQAFFDCRHSADGTWLVGQWQQPGFREPLALRRTGSADAAAVVRPAARAARRTARSTEWSSGELEGSRPVGTWRYFRRAADGSRQVAQVYDHDAERLTFASADEELYEVEISSGHWSHRFLTEAPWFVGGREALALHTGRLRYPPAALRTNTKGRVTVHLLVDTLGRVMERRVVRSLSSACDAEALRVARAIPDTFTPGRVGARAVPVRYSVSFLFELP